MSGIVSQSAQDHFNTRAAPAYSAFLKLRSRENAIGAAVAFWEMRDHLRQGKGTTAEFDIGLFKACPELQMIRDIADAAKHAELYRKSVIVTGISGIGSQGGEGTLISPLGCLTRTPT